MQEIITSLPWYLLGLATYHLWGKYRFDLRAHYRRSGGEIERILRLP